MCTIIAGIVVLLPLPSCVQGLQLVRVSGEGDKTAATSLLSSGVDPNFRHKVRRRMCVLLLGIIQSAAHFLGCTLERNNNCIHLYIYSTHVYLFLLINIHTHKCINLHIQIHCNIPHIVATYVVRMISLVRIVKCI